MQHTMKVGWARTSSATQGGGMFATRGGGMFLSPERVTV